MKNALTVIHAWVYYTELMMIIIWFNLETQHEMFNMKIIQYNNFVSKFFLKNPGMTCTKQETQNAFYENCLLLI